MKKDKVQEQYKILMKKRKRNENKNEKVKET